jgi:uncharacterized membrane protein YkoI
MKTKSSIALVSALLLATGATAFAAKSTASETMTMTDTKVTLTQAITIAEQNANGKATRAELETGKKGTVYDIEVISGTKKVDIQVDAQSGAVLAAAEDKEDRDGGQDEQD